MTMPNERMRALRWGGEALEEIGLDLTLTDEIRSRAMELRSAYPEAEALKQLVAEGVHGLPQVWTGAMCAALELFERIQFSGLGSEETRHTLLFTLRHYPNQYTIEVMAREDSLAWWLEPEDRRW